MQVDLASPGVMEWALFIPSLAALVAVLFRGFAPEGPPPPPARWGLPEVLVVIFVHVLAAYLINLALDIPFLPETWMTGTTLVLTDSITGLLILAVVRPTESAWPALGLLPPHRFRNLGSAAAAYLAFLIPLEIVTWAWVSLLAGLGYASSLQPALALYVEAWARGDRVGIVLIVVGAVVAAPVVEELLFRGFLFGILRAKVGPALGCVFASAIFALFHAYPEVIVPIFLVGLVLNLIYIRTGSLFYPILFHMLFNGGTLVWIAVMS
jgi:membrane protease YdiL (CAAX protease family)